MTFALFSFCDYFCESVPMYDGRNILLPSNAYTHQDSTNDEIKIEKM